jgi:hypothetical protein
MRTTAASITTFSATRTAASRTTSARATSQRERVINDGAMGVRDPERASGEANICSYAFGCYVRSCSRLAPFF